MIEFFIAANMIEMAAAIPKQDVAVSEIALVPIASGENDHIAFQIMCNSSGEYCVRLNRYYDGAEFQTNLTLIERGANGNIEYIREEALEPKRADNRSIGQVHPKIYIVADVHNPNQKTIIFGAIDNKSDMYSGGGANYQVLNLFETVPGESALTRLILSIPFSANKMIRACFGEDDYRLRRGACHDEYRFDAELKLSGRVQNGRPIFSYQSTATDFPRGSSLDKDNSGIRLRQADIVTVRNPKCSVRRSFIYRMADNFYHPNQELPDCSDYLL